MWALTEPQHGEGKLSCFTPLLARSGGTAVGGEWANPWPRLGDPFVRLFIEPTHPCTDHRTGQRDACTRGR